MTRWLFAVWLLAIAAAAHMLFKVEQEVRLLEDDLDDIELAILAETDALRALQADWSFLNRPERLAELSKEHLSFLPMRPRQITEFAALPPRPDDATLLARALAAEGVPLPKRKPALADTALGILANKPQPSVPFAQATARSVIGTDSDAAPDILGTPLPSAPLAKGAEETRAINPVTGLPLIRPTQKPAPGGQP